MDRLKPVLPFFLGCGLFITAFLTYLLTLCPSIYFGDSGELISMISVLGLPHPTGFPLYMLAGKMFSFIPLATAAFRINIMSAFFAALTPVMIFFALRFYSAKEENTFKSLYLPFAAAVLFVFSYTIWSQAVVARIYTLNAFFCALSLMLFMYYTEVSDSKKTLYLLALVTGLGSGIHLSFITFAAVLWIYILIKYPKNLLKVLPLTAVFIIAGASVYLYIIIRGGSDTPLKWSALSSFQDFIKYISQAQYKSKMFSRDPLGYAYFFDFIKNAVNREFAGIGLFLFLAGAAWSVLKKFRYFWPFIIIFVSNILTLAVYGNYTDMPLSFRYLIPSYIIFVFFIFLFCSYLYSAIKKSKAATAASLGCLLLIFAACFPLNRYENDRSSNFIAHNYPFDLLSPMPEKAYFFTSGDNQIYTMAYVKFILKKFTGVTVYDQIDTIFKDIRGMWLNSKSQSVGSNIISAFSLKMSPIYTTNLPGNPAIGNSSQGLIYKLYDGPGGSGDSLHWKLYSMKGILRDAGTFHAYEEREVVASYYFRMAQAYKSSGNTKLYAYLLDRAVSTGYDSAPTIGNVAIIWSTDYETPGAADKADELFNRALEIDPENELLYFNSGSFYASVSDWEKSSAMFKKASELNPGNIMARIYLGRVQEEINKKNEYSNLLKEQSIHYDNARKYFEAKDYDMAMDEFKRDIQINPTYDRSYFHIALIHSMRNEIEKAVPLYEKALSYNKKSTAILNNLGLCYIKLDKKSKAAEMFKLSLYLDPNQERVKKTLEELKK